MSQSQWRPVTVSGVTTSPTADGRIQVALSLDGDVGERWAWWFGKLSGPEYGRPTLATLGNGQYFVAAVVRPEHVARQEADGRSLVGAVNTNFKSHELA